MKASELVMQLIEHSVQLHPHYSKEQHLTWVAGLLADVVVEKNHHDNIVLTRLKSRIDILYKTKKIT